MSRRYPDTVVRLREAPGSYNSGGWSPGAVTETTMAASVQPLGLSSLPGEIGDQLLDRLRVFVADPHDLAAAFDDRRADRVRLADGRVFKVQQSETWPGSHTEAVLIREP